MYTKITNSIRVSAHPEALEVNSDPVSRVFAFAYTVTIDNLGAERVQLLERHWVVMSAETKLAEVVGPGVVGVQPILDPGGSFQYTSGTVIQDPVGSMAGTYTFRAADGKFFQVDIPSFDLFYPGLLH